MALFGFRLENMSLVGKERRGNEYTKAEKKKKTGKYKTIGGKEGGASDV